MFFSEDSACRNLLSSPTRRSSDLGRAAGRAAITAVVDRQHAEAAALQIGQPPDRDRKSTRLNSSHTVISYAVFCLKKKKSLHSSGLPRQQQYYHLCQLGLHAAHEQ